MELYSINQLHLEHDSSGRSHGGGAKDSPKIFQLHGPGSVETPGSGEPRDHCFGTPSRLSSKQKWNNRTEDGKWQLEQSSLRYRNFVFFFWKLNFFLQWPDWYTLQFSKDSNQGGSIDPLLTKRFSWLALTHPHGTWYLMLEHQHSLLGTGGRFQIFFLIFSPRKLGENSCICRLLESFFRLL